ncbi:MAG: DUF1592 domain-containing protein [Opitutales bacterium]
MPQRLLRAFRPASIIAALLAVCAGYAETFERAQPLLAQHCYSCHGNDDTTRKADLNLEFFQTEESWLQQQELLDDSLFYVAEHEMPPPDSQQPNEAERETLVAWMEKALETLETASRDDPGLVVAPRINHLEYDLVIRDLTGIDVQAAKMFPRDSGGGEGFTNVGEDLTVEAGLLQNSLEAARQVVSHAYVFPIRGVEWKEKPAPAMSQEKAAYYPVRIGWDAWHGGEANEQTKAHQQDLKVEGSDGKEIAGHNAAYLKVAWMYEHRRYWGNADLTYDEAAQSQDLYPSILERYHQLLTMDPNDFPAWRDGYAELVKRWQDWPGPGQASLEDIEERSRELNEAIETASGNDPLNGLDRSLRSTSTSGFGGKIWTAFKPYPGMAMDFIANKAEQKKSLEAEAKDLEWHPFYLQAEDIRRNASEASIAKLEAYIEEAKRVYQPDLEKDRKLVRETITDFASRAWRREMTPELLNPLMELYEQARAEGMPLNGALKQVMTAVLVSPRFLYRFQESEGADEPRELAPREIATRLSFALWGTIPDEELLAAADSGELQTETGLQAQVSRMVASDKARMLGRQFAAQWLHFEGFAERAQPDGQRYNDFTPEIARDMEEEATRFFVDLFQSNRPLDWIINADEVEMSLRLAGYYGIEDTSGIAPRSFKLRQWDRYDLPENRRGLLSMGAIMIGKSQPLRTSPIKRGAWVVIDLLGTPMPDPPPGVPQLSEDQVSDTGLTVAEQMAVHRNKPSCMSCHQKLDPMGLALENFGPDGRWRDKDAAGNPLITSAEAPDGTSISGIKGLADYLNKPYQQRMIAEQFSRKLLGYLLGRKVEIGDQGLIENMVAAMGNDEGRVMAALQTAINSKQFRYRRDLPAGLAVSQ